MTSRRQHNLKRLLAPRHIAVIGGRDAEIVIGECRRIGFTGQLWAVNPTRKTLGGINCHRKVADLPAAPDAVFLAIPPRNALDVVRELAAMDAGGVVCFTAGFGGAGREGGAADAELVEAAGDLAIVGPNCYGLINYIERVALWPFEHGGDCPGYGAAIVTQSGMLSSDITMNQRSLPLAMMISAGNQSVLALEDYLPVLSDYSPVRAIGIHIEGVRDVRSFAAAVAYVRSCGKPVVALKTGKSKRGADLTVSHTGSLSGDYQSYQALFRQLGIIEVNHPAEFVETLKLLCVSGIPAGKRVLGITCSGGGATLLADQGERLGLDFPTPGCAATKMLESLLPPIATVSNPLDYTTPIWGDGTKTRPVFDAALTDDYDVAVLIQDYPHPDVDDSKIFYLNDALAFAAAVDAKGIPAAVCSTLPENLDVATRATLIGAGVTPLQGLSEGLGALAAVIYGAGRSCSAELVDVPSIMGLRQISEAEIKQVLSSAGFRVPESRSVDTLDEVSQAAQALGFPLVLKYAGEGVQHKSDIGAVVTDLLTSADVYAAAKVMADKMAALDLLLPTDCFLLERQLPAPVAELVIAVRADEQFGLVMTLGSGGVLIELIVDLVTLILPVTFDDVQQALKSLRVMRLLDGYRGQTAVDLPALVNAILEIAAFCIEHKAELAELEINPLFVYPDHVVIIDALAQMRISNE